MKTHYITETRFWLDGKGELQSREVVNESVNGEIDMTPHPTECRVFPLGKEGEVIMSQQIIDSDDVPAELAEATTLKALEITFDLKE